MSSSEEIYSCIRTLVTYTQSPQYGDLSTESAGRLHRQKEGSSGQPVRVIPGFAHCAMRSPLPSSNTCNLYHVTIHVTSIYHVTIRVTSTCNIYHVTVRLTSTKSINEICIGGLFRVIYVMPNENFSVLLFLYCCPCLF